MSAGIGVSSLNSIAPQLGLTDKKQVLADEKQVVADEKQVLALNEGFQQLQFKDCKVAIMVFHLVSVPIN